MWWSRSAAATRRRSESGSSSCTRSSTSRSARARFRTSATGSPPAASPSSEGRFGTHEHFAADLPIHGERRFQAWVQVSMGCNSACAYCIVPAVRGREQSRRPGEIVAEVTRLAEAGVREITLLGQNVNSWGRDLAPEIRHRVRRAPPCVRRGAGHRAHPVHEPASEGLPRTGRRGDRRVRERLRARPPARAVGLVANPQGDAADVRPRAIPPARRDAARRDPRPRARHRSHRRLPRRDGRRLRGDALARRRGAASTARSRSSTRRARERKRRHCRTPCPTTSSTSGSRCSSSACSASPPSATPSASDGSRRCSSKGPSRTDASLVARPHAPQHDRQLRRDGHPRRARRRPRRGRDVDDAARARVSSLVAA